MQILGSELSLNILASKAIIGIHDAQYNLSSGCNWLTSILDSFLVAAQTFSIEASNEQVKQIVRGCFITGKFVKKELSKEWNISLPRSKLLEEKLKRMCENKSCEQDNPSPKRNKPERGVFHPIEAPPPTISNEDKINCQSPGCGSKFQSYWAAKHHHKKYHVELPYNTPPKLVNPDTKKLGVQKLRINKINCRICNDKVVRNKIKQHILNKHSQVVEEYIIDTKMTLRGWWQADKYSEVFSPVFLERGKGLPKHMEANSEEDHQDIGDDDTVSSERGNEENEDTNINEPQKSKDEDKYIGAQLNDLHDIDDGSVDINDEDVTNILNKIASQKKVDEEHAEDLNLDSSHSFQDKDDYPLRSESISIKDISNNFNLGGETTNNECEKKVYDENSKDHLNSDQIGFFNFLKRKDSSMKKSNDDQEQAPAIDFDKTVIKNSSMKKRHDDQEQETESEVDKTVRKDISMKESNDDQEKESETEDGKTVNMKDGELKAYKESPITFKAVKQVKDKKENVTEKDMEEQESMESLERKEFEDSSQGSL